MNHNEAKILLALQNLNSASLHELALSSIMTKSELNDILFYVENKGLITKRLLPICCTFQKK